MGKTKIVEPILFGFMFCRYLLLAIEDQLIYKKCCLIAFNETFCDLMSTNGTFHEKKLNMLQKQSANWKIYLSIVRTIPPAVMTIIYSAWSDHVGRKTIIVLPVVGASISAMSLIINSHFLTSHVYYMLIGEMFAAPFGNFVAMISATFCYAADITPLSFRTQRIVILESMIYISGAIGHLSGGQILHNFGFVYIYGLALFIYILTIIYWMFLKESFESDLQQKKKPLFEMFKLETFVEVFKFLLKKRKGNRRKKIWILFICFFFTALYFITLNNVSVLYLLHIPFQFISTQIGYFLGGLLAAKFVGALMINLILLHCLKISDFYVMLISFATYSGLFISMAASKEEWQVYSAGIWAFGVGVAIAVIRGKLSKLCSPSELGKLFSLISCVEVLVALFTGIAITSIYKATVEVNPAFTFYLVGASTLIPISLTIYLIKLENDDKKEEIRVFEGTPLLKSQTYSKESNEEFSSDNL